MEAVLDLGAHQRLIPLTTLSWSGPLRRGSRFVARTALGPIAFDDVMEVIEYAAATTDSPGRCLIEKVGPLLRGSIEVTVTPEGSGARVTWRQQLHVRHLPAALDSLAAWPARAAYLAMLRRLISRVEPPR